MSKERLIVGARGSALSRTQADAVIARLTDLYPSHSFIFKSVVTGGDKIKSALSTAQIGVFVKELEEALLRGEIDIAVHSLKDLPTLCAPGLVLGAVTRRLPPNDVLISRGNVPFSRLPPGAVLGTGSMRRTAQVLLARGDLRTAGIRGNIDTRLRKLNEDGIDGIICASCALARLGLEDRITEVLPLNDFLPSPGQGALAVEVRKKDRRIRAMVQGLEHGATALCVRVERDFLNAMGGGCHLPLGALAVVEGDTMYARGFLAMPDGSRVIRVEKESTVENSPGLGIRMARAAFEMGAKDILDSLGT